MIIYFDLFIIFFIMVISGLVNIGGELAALMLEHVNLLFLLAVPRSVMQASSL